MDLASPAVSGTSVYANGLNKKIHILLSQVYCVWQVVKTPTVIFNNPVFLLMIYGNLATKTSDGKEKNILNIRHLF